MNETLGDESLRAAFEVSGTAVEKKEHKIPNSNSVWMLPVRVVEVSEIEKNGGENAS